MPATATRKPNANGSLSALTPNTHPKAGMGIQLNSSKAHEATESADLVCCL